MSHLGKLFVSAVMGAIIVGSAHASDVYIEQAGSSSTIDITQTGDGNRVGSVTEATTINGSNTDIDITQIGSSNEVDIKTATGAASSDIELNFTGGSNTFDANIGAADSTIINADITGDSNQVEICGAFDTGIVANQTTAGACDTGADMSQNDIGIDLDVVGDGNKVSIARSGIAGLANTTEISVNIGSNVASNNNVVNIQQSSITESGTVDLTMDGSSNVVNIIQQ